MKKIISLAILVGCVVSIDSNQAFATSKPFTITISAETASVKAGSDVYIKIQMTNVSKHDLNCSIFDEGEVGADLEYWYTVRDSAGTALPERAMPEELGGHIRLCTIKPGQTATSGGNRISTLFDMKRPGEYLVQVTRAVSANSKDGLVKSNVIKITVTP